MDRVAEWKEFSHRMEDYIETTVEEYTKDGIDLMALTGSPIICIWNIIKCAWRIWNNNMKLNDLEEIAHYAAMAWKLSEGKIIKTKDDEKVPFKVLTTRRIA